MQTCRPVGTGFVNVYLFQFKHLSKVGQLLPDYSAQLPINLLLNEETFPPFILLLTPGSIILREKLMVAQIVRKFSFCYESRSFITVFTTTFETRARLTHSTTFQCFPDFTEIIYFPVLGASTDNLLKVSFATVLVLFFK